jgi:hypothetical protein
MTGTIWNAAKTTSRDFESREGDLTLGCHGKTLRACRRSGVQSREVVHDNREIGDHAELGA